MTDLVHLSGDELAAAEPVFPASVPLRVVVDAALEGTLADVYVDRANSPRIACVRLGVYAIIAGDSSIAAARAIVASQPLPCEFVLGGDPAWTALVREAFGDRSIRRVMQDFKADGVSRDRLAAQAALVPPGYAVRAMTSADCPQLGAELYPNDPSIFGSHERFMDLGFGVVADVGGAIGCAASTYAVSQSAAEIAIGTHPDHRRRGLAAAVGSAMVLECMDRGLTPCWTAGNPISGRTAERIGLTPGEEIPIEYVAE